MGSINRPPAEERDDAQDADLTHPRERSSMDYIVAVCLALASAIGTCVAGCEIEKSYEQERRFMRAQEVPDACAFLSQHAREYGALSFKEYMDFLGGAAACERAYGKRWENIVRANYEIFIAKLLGQRPHMPDTTQ